VVAPDEGVMQLTATDRAAAELVQLRYFSGLAMSEGAEILGMSLTARRFLAVRSDPGRFHWQGNAPV
jgi:hypothetical protein